MIYNRTIGAQLLGALFKKPEILADSDSYLLGLEDFPERLPRMIFGHLYNLYFNGMVKMDFESFVKEISKYPEQIEFFSQSQGEEFLLMAIEKGEVVNFDFYYNKIKKFSLLRDLEDAGFDISKWYSEGLMDIRQRELMEERLENASIHEIINSFQGTFFDIETRFINKKTFKVASAASGLDKMFEGLGKEVTIGLQLNGEKLSTIVMGARKKKVMSMSGESGAGKSRYAIASACKLAYPILWDQRKQTWTKSGSNQKVMLITTELSEDEVQTIILAYISGVDEDRIISKKMTSDELKRVQQAMSIMKHFEENFFIFLMPDPNVQQLNINVRRFAIQYQLDAIFYDYIHTSPNLLTEFSGARIREDVALMLLSTALKNLANEMNIFVWTGTQVNGEIEDGKIAGVEVIRGSKAIIDKVDVGMVLRKVGPADLKLVGMLSKQKGEAPTHSIDFFKNRRGKHNKVRLWIKLNLGTGRTQELFLTDEYGALIDFDLLLAEDSEVNKIVIEEIIEQKEAEKPKSIFDFKVSL